jgi:VanZ family protein
VSQAPTSSPTAWAVPGRRARLVATGAAIVGIVVHLWGLYRDHGPPAFRWFPQADKLEHLVGFGLPCFLVLLALHLQVAAAGRLLRTRAVAAVVGLFVVHAGVSEVVQGTFYTTRSGDPYDALADIIGTSLGLGAYLLVRRREAHGRA